MVLIVVKGDPPNKQQEAHKRVTEPLKTRLENVGQIELGSKLYAVPVKVEINIYSTEDRFERQGQDHKYIGDLDNRLSGVIDELKGTIIKDDSQIVSIVANKKIVDNGMETYFTVLIEPI